MPSSRDLPGFYYDSEKNRYFPIVSRGHPNQPKNQAIKEEIPHIKGETKPSTYAEANVLQILSERERGNACNSNMFKQRCMETNASKPWVWLYGTTPSADGAVEEFDAQVETNEGVKQANMIVWGNHRGDLRVCKVMQHGLAGDEVTFADPKQFLPPSDEPSSPDTLRPPCLVPTSLMRLSCSKVTSIKKLKEDGYKGRLILTTLGSGFEGGTLHLLKQRQDAFSSIKCVATDCSVWTAAYCVPNKATIGTSIGAALVDLETSLLRWLIHSKSDILSQECDLLGNLVFCGFRNGYISMVDMRSSSGTPRRMPAMQTRRGSSSSPLTSRPRSNLSRKGLQGHLQAREKPTPFRDKAAEIAKSFCESMRMNSAVCSLVLLRSDESYLLASAMNGDINLWDRRLVGKGPVLTYLGNQNSHLPLHLGVDSSESILASGGEDCAVRIWSLRSGQLLQTISNLPAVVYSFSTSESCSETPLKAAHAWGLWLGSSAGVMYMHG